MVTRIHNPLELGFGRQILESVEWSQWSGVSGVDIIQYSSSSF
jgi:hypothetical protein